MSELNRTSNEQHLFDYYERTGKPIKINIGSRNKPLPTYINIDVNPENHLADVIDNGFELSKFEDDSIDEVLSIHMFEHLSFKESKLALECWFKKLKKGGVLRISVPDAEKSAALMLLTGDRTIEAMFVGRQRENDQWDFHKSVYTKQWLKTDLEKIGFGDVKEWDWRTQWPHTYCDTFVSAYFPTFKKCFVRDDGRYVDFGGVLMSLNIEGRKP